MLGDRSMLQRRKWGKNTKMECCLRDQMENLAELWIQWWMIDQCQLYHSNIIFGWTWMWCLLTSHSVLPLQSSVCQQYKTTWFDATVSKHPIRCALFFFYSCIYFFESIRAASGPHVSLSSPLVKRVYVSAAGSDHVNIWTLNINCDLYPHGKITEPNGLADWTAFSSYQK